MEWCRMEGERSSECRKEEVRWRAGGDGGEDGWREQQRAGGSDWISTVCGQWTWGNEVRRLRDCKRGCVCTIKEKGKKKRMLVEITAVTSNGHSCSSCHKIASSYFPFLPVHSSVFLWVPLLSSLCPWLFLMVVTVAIFKADTADSSQRLLCQRNSCVCFGREFSHDSTLRMKLRQLA